MSLTEDVQSSGPPPTNKLTCSVGDWLASLGDEDRVTAERVLDDRASWSHARAHEMFRRHGLKSGVFMVGHHRRGLCSCDTQR